jgi:hypothetical protein
MVGDHCEAVPEVSATGCARSTVTRNRWRRSSSFFVVPVFALYSIERPSGAITTSSTMNLPGVSSSGS